MNDLYLEARVSKRTLYQHFAGKDELVAAYLEAAERDTGSAPRRCWRAPTWRRVRGCWSCSRRSPQQPRPLRGDPFVSAAVEFPDPSHPGPPGGRRARPAAATTADGSGPGRRRP